jgi:hypothetical protein
VPLSAPFGVPTITEDAEEPVFASSCVIATSSAVAPDANGVLPWAVLSQAASVALWPCDVPPRTAAFGLTHKFDFPVSHWLLLIGEDLGGPGVDAPCAFPVRSLSVHEFQPPYIGANGDEHHFARFLLPASASLDTSHYIVQLDLPSADALRSFQTAFLRAFVDAGRRAAAVAPTPAAAARDDVDYLIDSYQPAEIAEESREHPGGWYGEQQGVVASLSGPLEPEEAIRTLEVGKATQTAFVSSDRHIDVFATSSDALEHRASFSLSGRSLHPGQVLTQHSDRKLFVLDRETRDRACVMDVERGKAVRDLSFLRDGAALPLTAATYLARSDATTNSDVLLGLNQRGFYTLDMRAAKPVVGQSMIYAKNPKLSAAVTDDLGRLAVADSEGTLRLYAGGEKLGNRANTQISGSGYPIFAVDASPDGRYILATTSTALLIFDTHFDTDKGTKNAYQSRAGKNKRPAISLRLSVSHAALTGAAPFSAAHFSAPDPHTGKPSSISTSCGSYLVVFSFSEALAGRSVYDLRRTSDTTPVVAASFAYGSVSDILCASMSHLDVTHKAL